MTRSISEHRVTHVGVVLDESTSMDRHKRTLVQAFDALVDTLARRSKELNEEIRLSVWAFSGSTDGWAERGRLVVTQDNAVKNIVWDIDVLRLPSISKDYDPWGNTALIDGALTSIRDMKTVSQKYGDHSFLLYVLTDGQENRSRGVASELSREIAGLDDNWTVAALVPDAAGIHEAKRFGFPAGNIERWDTTSASGATEVGGTITRATDSYMASRASGVRSTKNLFVDTSAAAVNRESVKAAMRPADPASYMLHFIPPVSHPFPKALSRRVKYRLDEYIRGTLGLTFVLGRNYYELIKSELVQPQKDIALVDRKTDEVFIGREARDLINLPVNAAVRVRPDFNDQYRIFIRSDSTNRNMLEGQRLLIVR